MTGWERPGWERRSYRPRHARPPSILAAIRRAAATLGRQLFWLQREAWTPAHAGTG